MCIWEHIIDSNNIDLNKEYTILTSKDIKNYKKTWKGKEDQFEPRLLCKMDTSKSRPQCFIDNNISIFICYLHTIIDFSKHVVICFFLFVYSFHYKFD